MDLKRYVLLLIARFVDAIFVCLTLIRSRLQFDATHLPRTIKMHTDPSWSFQNACKAFFIDATDQNFIRSTIIWTIWLYTIQ